MSAVAGILNKQKLTATELAGRTRVQALKKFQSGTDWHRADQVDRLSEEEASIIAARIVRRVQSKTPLPQAKAETLQGALSDTLKKQFLGSREDSSRTYEQERAAFLQKAASYLNESELTALREAVAPGYRPLPGEK